MGSNSFHLVVGDVVDGELSIVDRLRERVALAAGLDERNRLTPEAQERALACLERFGQRLRDVPPDRVRAVGTNTFRLAKRARRFLEAAEAALGHEIEVISGVEEARLVYQGVVQDVSPPRPRLLVVDIGGGSTECVLGEAYDVLDGESLYMGCVSWSLRFFEGGVVRRKSFEKARLAALQELEPMERRFREQGWERCLGSSGTIAAVSSILRANEWTDGEITAKALRRLRKTLLTVARVDRLELEGLSNDRRPVIAGGLAILIAVFDALGIESCRPAEGALREGLLHDLLGRIEHHDVRDRSIQRLTHRYRVDEQQARRVARTAMQALEQVCDEWDLDRERSAQFLSWAAMLHEVGLAIAHSGHHRHGGYLVENSDLPGFSREEQALLAALVRGHRRKLREEYFEALTPAHAKLGRRLCVLLRLAVQLNRSRSPRALPSFEVTADDNRITLAFPAGWLDGHPLSRADLEYEADQLRALGLELTVS